MQKGQDYIIKTATSADMDDIFRFLQVAFFPYEPLRVAEGMTCNSPEALPLLLTLDDGLTIIAEVPLPENKRHIIGICFGEENTPDSWKKREEGLKHINNPSVRRLEELNIYANNTVDIWNIIKGGKRFDLHHLAVDPEYRGQGIGIALARKCIEIAKSRGHTILYLECSSIFSIKVGENLGMKCIYKMYFKDYKGADGFPVFNVPYPHLEYRLYIKDI